MHGSLAYCNILLISRCTVRPQVRSTHHWLDNDKIPVNGRHLVSMTTSLQDDRERQVAVTSNNIHTLTQSVAHLLPFITNYHTIDLYQPWKIACGRADITLATGWYNVNDGRLQTTSHASATDVSDWLLQAALSTPLPRRYVNTAADDQSFYHSAKLFSTYFK